MKQEFESIEEKGTWSLVDLPKGRWPIDVKWVLHTKCNENRHIKKHKACLVTCSFTQIEGIDYNETYLPTTMFTTLQIMIAFAVAKGWPVH